MIVAGRKGGIQGILMYTASIGVMKKKQGAPMLNTHMRRKGGAGCSPGLLCTTPPSVSQEQDMPGPKITLIPGHFSANSLSFTLAISDRTPDVPPTRFLHPGPGELS